MSEASPNKKDDIRPGRARRMFAALINGASLDAIGAEEGLPTNRVETVVHEELGRRWVAPIADFAKIQIARLENLYVHAMDAILRGELAALGQTLRIFDRLDRYHGFNRVNPSVENYGEEERERLIAKLNQVVERLADEPPSQK